MEKEALIYRMTIDDQDIETAFNSNALVSIPAHLKEFNAFSEQVEPEFFFNDEEMMITGVAIAADVTIPRYSKELGKHFVVFLKEDIKKLWLRANELGYINNVNKEHVSSDKINTSEMFLVEQWIVDRANNKGVPAALESQDIKDGSLMFTYKVKSPKLWADIKAKKYTGFSIEGLFLKVPLQKIGAEKMSSIENKLFNEELLIKDIYFGLKKRQMI